MHLMLHIFKKDVRRLWWAVAATLLLLAALAHADRWRADWIVGSTEGWLNLLLPLAWCCLVALVVNEEPLVDDREFWTTRPYRWPTLLGSKLLFVALFIHVPSLIADAAILAFHGFQPLEYLPQLLWKQIVLAAVLTVPAIALAALMKNIAHFLLAAIVILGAAAYLAGVVEPFRTPWMPSDWVRYALAAFVLAVAACALVTIQYARRRTVPVRIAGTAAVVLAGLLFGCLPPPFTDRVQAMLHPAHAHIAFHLSSAPQDSYPTGSDMRQTAVQVAIPLTVSGLSSTPDVQIGQPTLEIVGPEGQRYRTPARSAYRNFETIDIEAYIYTESQSWLALRLRPSVYDRIKNGKVRVKGTSTLTLYRPGQTTWMPIGASQVAPGAGHCSNTIVEAPRIFEEAALKVLCESPDAIPTPTRLRLWQPETGRDWSQPLGGGRPNLSGPRDSWLSPLNRTDTLWQLAPAELSPLPGNRWLVPRDALPNAKLAITPYQTTAWAVVDFDFPDITLSDYVKPPAR